MEGIVKMNRKGRTPIPFEDKYIPEPNSGCWIWIRACHRQGYGWHCGELAHRFSFRKHHGVDPGEQKVLHRCDNPYCVNPDHLFIGSQEDNVLDCYRKNRHSQRHSDNGNAKLTADDVRFIRSQPRTKYVCLDLSKRFGVAHSTICGLRQSRRTWKNL